MKKLYMVGNTHFDPVWLWTWDEAMSSIRATFRSALDRMNEDENFKYSFATPPVFDWIKNTDPKMFEEIKQRVAEGRWDICEGWWLQPDCYSASGESYVRQSLYGQKYLMDNFGIMSKCVFNVDSFGHSPQLPQILQKSGIPYYCFVRPEKRWVDLKKDCFIWTGIDGTKVFAYRAEEVYSKDLKSSMEVLNSKGEDSLLIFGVTDHGGAPTKKDIALINKTPNAIFSSVSNFFENQNPTYIVKGELLTGDFGVYADLPETKKFNRIAENAILNAEKALVFANKFDSRCDDCFKDVLFNQFHDIIGGSSIKDAYVDSRNLYGRAIQTANEIMNYSVQSICKDIKTVGKNPDDIWNLIVWNFNGNDFDGYIESEVQWAHEFDWYEQGLYLEDEKGNKFPCQIIEAKAVIPRFRSRFVCKVQVPSFGYKTFKVVKTFCNDEVKENKYPIINNNKITVEFDTKNGGIKRVLNSKNNTISNKVLNPMIFEDLGDTWAFNIDGYGNKSIRPKFCGVKVLECGTVRTLLKERYEYNDSIIDLYYYFYNNEEYFDVKYRINSNEKQVVFKLVSDTESNQHEVGVPYGKVIREVTKRKDVPLSVFLKVDNITYVCDSVFSYNMNEKQLGLTLLRNVIYGDLRIRDLNDYDYDILSQGITEGKIRVDFTGDIKYKNSFINPPHIVVESNHNGVLPSEKKYASIDNLNVDFSVIKNKTDGEGKILRFVETEGKEQKARIKIFDNEFDIILKPFEIKTYLYNNKKIVETTLLETEMKKEKI